MCTFKIHTNHMVLVNTNFSTLTAMYSTNTSNQGTMVGELVLTFSTLNHFSS